MDQPKISTCPYLPKDVIAFEHEDGYTCVNLNSLAQFFVPKLELANVEIVSVRTSGDGVVGTFSFRYSPVRTPEQQT